LIENREQVVSKDQIFDAVWDGRIVSEATLSSRINAARRALGDSGDSQSLIRTVQRRGFRFVGTVDVETGPGVAGAPVAEPASAETDVATGGSIAQQEVRFCRTPDGIHLAVATVGQGDDLVKTANWLNHVEFDWHSPLMSPLLRHLAERHRLIRYDARGNGLSDWTVEDISFAAFASDFETIVESLGLTRFSLFGISQGGAVAIAYAARHPERVERLVLHGAYARGRNHRQSALEAQQAQAFLTLMRSGWGDEHSAFMQAFSSIYLPRGTMEQIRWFTELQRKTTSADNAIRIRQACDDIDVVALLPLVSAPTLVLHSRHDNVVPFDEGRLIAASIPGARLVSLESDNHIVLEGELAWNRFIGEIEAFLAVKEA
jgi:pimeloyl-ACP methyl ester carboxylesterase